MDGMAEARRLTANEKERRTGFLDLGMLGLHELPEELFELEHLERLNLGDRYLDQAQRRHHRFDFKSRPNSLSTLPPALSRLRRLRWLSLGSLQVTTLDAVHSLTALEGLEFSGTSVETLEPLRGLSSLHLVDCSNTAVETLEPLRHILSLRSLDCSLTLVKTLNALECLRELKSITCSQLNIDTLEPLRALPSLQSVDCSSTRIHALEPLHSTRSLQSVNCSSTLVHTLEPLRGLPSLQYLNCSSTLVDTLEPLRGLPSLQHLNCYNTQVDTLEPLRGLSSLLSVNCSDTAVNTLEPLRDLPSLLSVACSDTAVNSLGPLRDLSTLLLIDCSGTGIDSLEPLQTLSSIESVDCSRTAVSSLDVCTGLSRLKYLRCSNTRVTDLRALVALPCLSSLSANSCRLDDFPVHLLRSSTLENLVLHNTTIPGVPREVLSARIFLDCLASFRAHVDDLGSDPESLRETKLVILGNGRVGKTQIARRLRALPFDEQVPSTHGISVTSEPWSSAPGETLNLWDFGGQDIYHGAHALFLQTRAIFLIVWHPDYEQRQEEEHGGLIFRSYPLSYWIEYVRALAPPGSPIVVVQSRCERREQEIKRLSIPHHHLEDPNVKLCWYSAATNRGRAALDEALQDAAAALRERDGVASIGLGRAKVLRQLVGWRQADAMVERGARQHRVLTVAEFEQLCADNGGVSSPANLLQYLHNLGVVFYRAEYFDHRIVLDQTWALDAVYALFERQNAYRQLLGSRGRFTRGQLELLVWGDYSVKEQALFLSLMRSTGMSFVSRSAAPKHHLEAEYIAPDLLPEKTAVAPELAGRWDDAAPSHRLEYRYDFLHSGLARALISDAGARATEAGVYWKYGFWVYDRGSGARARLEQIMDDERRGRIVLEVQGGRDAELGTWFRERIEERNRWFGYGELTPSVNDFPDAGREPAPRHVATKNAAASPELEMSREDASTRRREPTFDKLPASAFPRTGPQAYISYAWGDKTSEGEERTRIVDQLRTALNEDGIEVLIDREQLRPGQRISEFMDRLAAGDHIVVVVSDKYLRSPYCMYELFKIYRNCGTDSDRFLNHIVPLTLPDAALSDVSERLTYARHWKQEHQKLRALIAEDPSLAGKEAFAKFKNIEDFAHNVSDVLEYLVDQLMPRDFDRMTAEGFREVRALLRSRDEGDETDNT